MQFKYEPTLAKEEIYHFDFPIHHSKKISRGYNSGEILEIFSAVVKESMTRNGLDRIQKLTDVITGKVILVISHLSEKQKQEIVEIFENPVEYLRKNVGMTIVFEDEL